MEINRINYPSPIQAIQFLKKHISLPSANQQKIMMVAGLIFFAGFILYYTFSLIGRKFCLRENNTEEDLNNFLIYNPALASIQNQSINTTNNEHINISNENNYIQPKEVPSSEEDNEKYFKENISLYANILFKNALCLDEARVILIGEKHNIPEHEKLEGMILKCFGKQNDILLLEGNLYEEKEAADPTTFFSPEVKKLIPKKYLPLDGKKILIRSIKKD